ncbi:FkbM family methyltransferase [Neolewinella agarilytica]|uniref:Methyltransferase, FkbM family n=1 Tax=Neolewinella agarilytica TaxID=478744 RepID=A0A1H9E094_9BACT|nr:FkbM family methyltransferase [Neolewinella agarilytica]SEQ19126.1 methyltransferase, FkbM family [Neolewinella agarilytica]
MLEFLRSFRRKLKARSLGYEPLANYEAEWYGNANAGFFVCPELVPENAIVYSIGTGMDISFDRSMLAKHNCKVFAFDPTPKSINWVSQQEIPEGFTFTPLGIGDKNETTTFFLPENDAYVSGSVVGNTQVDQSKRIEVELRTLHHLAAANGHQHIDVLKMDIEGSEYQVIPEILGSGVTVGQLLLEFHHRMVEGGEAKTRKTMDLLRKQGYLPFAYSDRLEEVSFYKQ